MGKKTRTKRGETSNISIRLEEVAKPSLGAKVVDVALEHGHKIKQAAALFNQLKAAGVPDIEALNRAVIGLEHVAAAFQDMLSSTSRAEPVDLPSTRPMTQKLKGMVHDSVGVSVMDNGAGAGDKLEIFKGGDLYAYDVHPRKKELQEKVAAGVSEGVAFEWLDQPEQKDVVLEYNVGHTSIRQLDGRFAKLKVQLDYQKAVRYGYARREASVIQFSYRGEPIYESLEAHAKAFAGMQGPTAGILVAMATVTPTKVEAGPPVASEPEPVFDKIKPYKGGPIIKATGKIDGVAKLMSIRKDTVQYGGEVRKKTAGPPTADLIIEVTDKSAHLVQIVNWCGMDGRLFPPSETEKIDLTAFGIDSSEQAPADHREGIILHQLDEDGYKQTYFKYKPTVDLDGGGYVAAFKGDKNCPNDICEYDLAGEHIRCRPDKLVADAPRKVRELLKGKQGQLTKELAKFLPEIGVDEGKRQFVRPEEGDYVISTSLALDVAQGMSIVVPPTTLRPLATRLNKKHAKVHGFAELETKMSLSMEEIALQYAEEIVDIDQKRRKKDKRYGDIISRREKVRRGRNKRSPEPEGAMHELLTVIDMYGPHTTAAWLKGKMRIDIDIEEASAEQDQEEEEEQPERRKKPKLRIAKQTPTRLYHHTTEARLTVYSKQMPHLLYCLTTPIGKDEVTMTIEPNGSVSVTDGGVYVVRATWDDVTDVKFKKETSKGTVGLSRTADMRDHIVKAPADKTRENHRIDGILFKVRCGIVVGQVEDDGTAYYFKATKSGNKTVYAKESRLEMHTHRITLSAAHLISTKVRKVTGGISLHASSDELMEVSERIRPNAVRWS